MELWQSLPLVSIILPLFSAAVMIVLRGKGARAFCFAVLGGETLLSGFFLIKIRAFGQSYTYPMGHYPAPFGNEIRAGLFEAIALFFFMLILLLSLAGGLHKLEEHVRKERMPLYYAMILLMTASLSAQIFTNDLFTSYVFVEIMTLAAAGLIAAHGKGRAILASARYMVMNMVASSLFLLGIVLLYDLTGHLLMSPIRQQVAALAAEGQYKLALIVVVGLITVGLSIKSALFPFHSWVPDAYGTASPASAAIMSGLVSHAYLFLLMKIIYRVFGTELFAVTGIENVLFVFGLAGMLIGSIVAILQQDLKRMIAYSSVAQVGYIFMGIGLGSRAGMLAAAFHLLAHAACKSMLFITTDALIRASGGSSDLRDLRGAGFRARLTAAAFAVGSISMVGFPFLGGFPSKVNFVRAVIDIDPIHRIPVLIFLVLSTWLNTLYFLRAVISLYTMGKQDQPRREERVRTGIAYALSLAGFIALNAGLGLFSQRIINGLLSGLSMFS